MSKGPPPALSTAVLQALPQPVIVCTEDRTIVFVNYAAEAFFGASMSVLSRQRLDDLIAFGSPIIGLMQAVADRRGPMTEYRVRVGSSRFSDVGDDRVVDVFASPLSDSDGRIALLFQERTMADKIDRQLVSRGAARSVTGLASMLAHEIKNPLSGIRGAAQLLEQSVTPDELPLARLVRDEVDRIVDLIDRVEVFGDDRPIEREPINIHVVLDRVKLLAKSGVARGITFHEEYDPSLPPVGGNRDQLIQVFLNLVKNAAEALERTPKPEIRFSTAFRPGIRIAVQGVSERISLPLARLVRDEVDRIVDLIDRVEVFGDDRPIEREPINIHVVLDRVKLLAKSGVARGITFHEEYDPSLPPVGGNRDQLIQVFLNLVKNAAEALERTPKPEIRFSTAFRPGIRIAVQGVSERISLPLEIIIEDNGPGVAPDMVPILFDPFVTTKANGSGLGLALVAKIIGDHGGVVDMDSRPGRTRFRILLPVAAKSTMTETVSQEVPAE